MYASLTGKGIIAFSDPAGAKACLGLAQILKSKQKKTELLLLSNKNYSFYSDWNIPVIVTDGFNENLFSGKADWVFTGTSHPDSSRGFELEFIKYAKQHHIPSYSFIDHWTGILIRFLDGARYVFPDQVIVLDEKARRLAIQEGIPGEIISVSNNPYLDYIKTLWKPDPREQLLLKEFSQKNHLDKIILYAPDPLSLRGEEVLWGFNEAVALRDLLVATENKNFSILIKKHPLQPENVLEEVVHEFREKDGTVFFVESFKSLDLMYFADVIVGFHSNFLLEANALGKKIIRYFPESLTGDPLSHLDVGAVATTRQQLSQLIV